MENNQTSNPAVREDVALFFFEAGDPKALMFNNGHSTFYRLKKMNREEIALLLQK